MPSSLQCRMMASGALQYLGFAEVREEEPPTQTMHQAHRIGCKFVARRLDAKLVELPISTHEDLIALCVGSSGTRRCLCRRLEANRQSCERLALFHGTAPRSQRHDKSFHFTANLQSAKLHRDINLRHQCATLGQHDN